MLCIAQIKLKKNDEKKKVEGKNTIVFHVKEYHFGFFEQTNHYKVTCFFFKIKKMQVRGF
jgi:hypothetical protein